MRGNVISCSYRGLLLVRPYSVQAAVSHKVEQADKISLHKQDCKTTTLPNGLTVASIENNSPISRVGVIIKAGPRYEPANQLGISHCLRNCTGLSTHKYTSFGVTKGIELIGASLQCSSTKENLYYEFSCNRDNLIDPVKILADVITRPVFQNWEISDQIPRMKTDLATVKADPFAVLHDALHQASFRGGLRNSLYSPEFMIGKHNAAMLQEYILRAFGTDRAAVVGLGVDHGHLLEIVSKYFLFQGKATTTDGSSKFKGGDWLIDAALPITYAAVVTEGSGLNNKKDLLCLAILQKILGEGPHIKYSDHITTKLGAVAAKATSHPFAVSGLNLSYSDTGLFGFLVAGCPDDMNKLIKELVAEMRTLKKVTAKEVTIAKHQLKASLHMSQESMSDQLEEMALSALSTGQVFTASDIEKDIEAITVQDVVAVATKILKGKPAMAAYGQLQQIPTLDELL